MVVEGSPCTTSITTQMPPSLSLLDKGRDRLLADLDERVEDLGADRGDPVPSRVRHVGCVDCRVSPGLPLDQHRDLPGS